MTLVFESEDANDQPGLHAFIVGVSAYPHLVQGQQGKTEENLGLEPLSSAALTAYRIYKWLEEHRDYMPVPLATCNLLLSPSEVELEKETNLEGLAESPTLDHFKDAALNWRERACSHRDNVALFYFAGHGAQRAQPDHVLLLHDFGNDTAQLLSKAVDTNQLFRGMASTPSFPQMAMTQLYFIDACRVKPKVFQKYEHNPTGQLWDAPAVGPDDRVAPVFYTATPGRTSFGIKGDQTIFSKALLECLNGGAARRVQMQSDEPVWQVSLHSLMGGALGHYIQVINKRVKGKQRCVIEKHNVVEDVLLCNLDRPPDVDVSIEIDPHDALDYTKLVFLDAEDEPVRELTVPLHPHPYRDRLPGGTYRLSAKIVPPTPGYRDRNKLVSIDPPKAPLRVDVLRRNA